MWVIIRSMLYSLGRSNKSYYDHSIIHPGVFSEHFSWFVYWSYTYHWYWRARWLRLLYFFKHNFFSSLKANSLAAFFLWTVPIYFILDLLSPLWSLYILIDPVFYRNVNIKKWTNDWYFVGWAQYYFFYRYFRPVRYFFFLRIYWFELGYVLKNTWELMKEIAEDEGGPIEMAQWRRDWDRKMLIEKLQRQGLPIPPEEGYDVKTKVVLNKEVFYSAKVQYYVIFRNMYKSVYLRLFNLKNKSSWI